VEGEKSRVRFPGAERAEGGCSALFSIVGVRGGGCSAGRAFKVADDRTLDMPLNDCGCS